MERPEKIQKNFSKSLLELLEQAQVMHNLFIIDWPDFTAKFPFMDSTYANDFQTAIDAADAEPDDEAVLDQQQMLTYQLEQRMQEARNAYTTLLTYVQLAYPKNASILNHFGQERYRRARNNQLKMKELMEYAHSVANAAPYQPVLIAKGFQQTDIDNLLALANALESENASQEGAKINRSFVAQVRTVKYNTVYNFMQELNMASKVVYMDNYAKQQQYLLYNEGSGLNVLAAYENTIAANGLTAAGPLVANTKKLRLTLVSGENLEFGLSFAVNAAFDGNTITLGAPEALTVNITDFATTATNIVVRNQSLTLAGSFKVECLG